MTTATLTRRPSPSRSVPHVIRRVHTHIHRTHRLLDRLSGQSIHPPTPQPLCKQVNQSIIGFLLAFAAYILSHSNFFAYVENDPAALAAKSAR